MNLSILRQNYMHWKNKLRGLSHLEKKQGNIKAAIPYTALNASKKAPNQQKQRKSLNHYYPHQIVQVQNQQKNAVQIQRETEKIIMMKENELGEQNQELKKQLSERKIISEGQNFINLQLLKYKSMINSEGKKIQPVQSIVENKSGRANKNKSKQKHSIFISKGNNHQLIRQIFIDHFKYSESLTKEGASVCWLQWLYQKQPQHFVKQSSIGLANDIYSNRLPEILKHKESNFNHCTINYLDYHYELTNKERLFRNMSKINPNSLGVYLPKTFIIDFKENQTNLHKNICEFLIYYFSKQKLKHKKNKSKVLSIKNYFADICISSKYIQKYLEKVKFETNFLTQKSANKLQTIEIPNEEKDLSESYAHEEIGSQEEKKQQENEGCLWILKPTSLNRGRGIHVFSSLKQLSKLLSESSFEISAKMYNESIKPNSYVIQEYIQKPLLIEGYKFDIRMWVLMKVIKLNGKKSIKAYLFRNGYSRLASLKYIQNQNQPKDSKIDSTQKQPEIKNFQKKNINNRFIHLTNNAVQKDSKQYGVLYEGNQLSIQDTVKYLNKNSSENVLDFQKLIKDMEWIVLESVLSVKDKLVMNNSQGNFQLFGYDFLLDSAYKLWLIEINCNPCIEESSQLLGKLLRQMLTELVDLVELNRNNLQSEEGKHNQKDMKDLKEKSWIQII